MVQMLQNLPQIRPSFYGYSDREVTLTNPLNFKLRKCRLQGQALEVVEE